MTDDAWTIYGPPVRGRRCGGCTACCITLPVPPMGKGANERCPKLCSRGCSIYSTRPTACRLFMCRWLMDESTAGLRRPDKAGYVIDPSLDRIVANGTPVDCVQIWVDPKRPDAHRDPALRAWLAGVADRYGLIALVRWNSRDAMALVAPALTSDGEWLEAESNMRAAE